MALTNRQRVFVERYLVHWNASRAAREAGYQGKADVTGARLLGNVSIEAAIEARLAELKMSADEVLTRLTEQARGDIADIIAVDERGGWNLDLKRAIASGKSRLIKKIKETDNGPEVELYSSQEALALLGKAHGLFKEQVEHTGAAELLSAANELDKRLAALAARNGARDVPDQPVDG